MLHLFFCQLLPPPDYLYPGPIHLLGKRLVATVLQALLHTNNSGAAAEPAHDQRQGIAKSSKFPGMKCYGAEEAPGPDATQGKASPAQPQQPWAPLRRYIISCPQLFGTCLSPLGPALGGTHYVSDGLEHMKVFVLWLTFQVNPFFHISSSPRRLLPWSKEQLKVSPSTAEKNGWQAL